MKHVHCLSFTFYDSEKSKDKDSTDKKYCDSWRHCMACTAATPLKIQVNPQLNPDEQTSRQTQAHTT